MIKIKAEFSTTISETKSFSLELMGVKSEEEWDSLGEELIIT